MNTLFHQNSFRASPIFFPPKMFSIISRVRETTSATRPAGPPPRCLNPFFTAKKFGPWASWTAPGCVDSSPALGTWTLVGDSGGKFVWVLSLRYFRKKIVQEEYCIKKQKLAIARATAPRTDQKIVFDSFQLDYSIKVFQRYHLSFLLLGTWIVFVVTRY